MPPKKSATGDSSAEDEINVNKVVETKQELDKVPRQCLEHLSAAILIPETVLGS